MKRSVYVQPVMSGKFCRGYRAIHDPSLEWLVPGNPTTANPHAETFRTLHLHDRTFLQVGISERNGAITSIRHVMADGSWHWLRHYDNGQCFLGNLRWRTPDVEGNPTEDGGSAGTDKFYPSIGDPVQVWVDSEGSLAVRRRRYAIIDFDPDNLEDGYGRRPVPANLPADTQMLWTGGTMESSHTLRIDGRCHTYEFTIHDHDGSPDGMTKAWASAGMLIADIARGGADLLDLATEERRMLRGDEWIGAPHPTIQGARRRGWNGFKSRIDLLDPGVKAVAQPPAWASGHAGVILHTGRDGTPDGKAALGIYAKLVDTTDRDAIGPQERMEVKVMRNPQFVADLESDGVMATKTLAQRNSGYGVVVGSHGSGSYPAGHGVMIRFHWITGKPDQVEAALRLCYQEESATPW
jgi:hypothetical protein